MNRSRLRIALLVAALLAAPAASGQQIDFGRLIGLAGKVADASTEMPVQQELQLGAGISAQLLGNARLLPDPVLQRYVNQVGRWLAMHTERPELPWRFGVLDSDVINAYAAPGGFIFITRGMFRLLGSESELAGVLAHEIGHVLRRHHLNAIRAQAQAGIAGDVLALMAGSKGVNLDAIVDVGVNLYSRGLDRGDELEADRVGVVVAARAGYEPYGLTRLLQALGALRPGNANFSQMFSTHPPVGERLATLDGGMRGRLDHLSVAARGEQRFASIRARVR